MIVIGAAGGYMVPEIAQKLITYKGRQNKKEYPTQSKYLSVLFKTVFLLVSMIGLGTCGYFGSSWLILLHVALIWLIGAVIFVVDIRIRIIANETVAALFMLGVGFRIMMDGMKALPNSLITMMVLLLLWTIFCKLLGSGQIGAGDVKLCAVIGFMFGYPNVIGAMLVTSVTLLVCCLIGMKAYKMTMRSMLPMGPFLVIGMLTEILTLLSVAM